jgi:chemotaxis protein CheC
MNLTAVQEDALTEVINIGFGRAAASLSKLTGQRVQLEVRTSPCVRSTS